MLYCGHNTHILVFPHVHTDSHRVLFSVTVVLLFVFARFDVHSNNNSFTLFEVILADIVWMVLCFIT